MAGVAGSWGRPDASRGGSAYGRGARGSRCGGGPSERESFGSHSAGACPLRRVKLHRSALKHGVTAGDAVQAATWPLSRPFPCGPVPPITATLYLGTGTPSAVVRACSEPTCHHGGLPVTSLARRATRSQAASPPPQTITASSERSCISWPRLTAERWWKAPTTRASDRAAAVTSTIDPPATGRPHGSDLSKPSGFAQGNDDPAG